MYFPSTSTNNGFMTQTFGEDITIEASGIYLLSMRPHRWFGEVGSNVGMIMTRSEEISVWVVVTEHVASGETIALRLEQSTRLRFYLFLSNACKIGQHSFVSVALAKGE